MQSAFGLTQKSDNRCKQGLIIMPKQKTLRLILGDQLNEKHSWFRYSDENVTYALMEIRQETDYHPPYPENYDFFSGNAGLCLSSEGYGTQSDLLEAG